MAEWKTNAHSVTRDNEAITRIAIWSGDERRPSTLAYHTIQVAIGSQDGKRDVVGTYDGSKDLLAANAARDIFKGIRMMRPGETLLVIATNTGSPALDAGGMTVQITLQLVAGNGALQLFQASGYVADQRTREAIEGLSQRLNTSGVTEWTVSVPVRDPRETQASSTDSDVCQGRIGAASTTTLRLSQHIGKIVVVGSSEVEIPDAGIDLTTSQPVVGADGLAGSNPSASTTYHVYLAGPGARYRANGIVLSATAPTRLDGAYYLGASGNPAQYRFLGWARTNASTQFTDSETARHVVNYYNRLHKTLLTCPGYNDNNTDNTWTTASTTWVKINGGTGSTVSYVANGEDGVSLHAFSSCANSGTTALTQFGIGDNSATTAYSSATNVGTQSTSIYCGASFIPAVGWREAHFLARVSTGTGTYVLDRIRGGGSSDPRASVLHGVVMA